MEDSNPIQIEDFPNEILHKIMEFRVQSDPNPLAPVFDSLPLLGTSQRWRDLALLCVPPMPTTSSYPSWELKLITSWAHQERQDEKPFKKLILRVDLCPPPPVTLEEILELGDAAFDRFKRTGPVPYQIAFERGEELELEFKPALRVFYSLRDAPVQSSLKFLEIKYSIQGGALFMNLHAMTFPHLKCLIMLQTLTTVKEFQTILRIMPNLEDCRIELKREDRWDLSTVTFKSTSLVSLFISFRCASRSTVWTAASADMPNLETLTCIAINPFQKAMVFASPSLKTIITHMDGTCADRQTHLTALLEKCPGLEKLAIPKEFLVLPAFFDKVSSGALVPNLQEFECGPFMLGVDSLLGYLHKKGFVDVPAVHSESDAVSPTPVRAFKAIKFRCIAQVTRKEIEEKLEGVTKVVEFLALEEAQK